MKPCAWHEEALEQAQGGGGQAVPARAYDILSLVAAQTQ